MEAWRCCGVFERTVKWQRKGSDDSHHNDTVGRTEGRWRLLTASVVAPAKDWCLGLKLLQSSHLLLLFMFPQFCGCQVIAVLYLSVLSDPRTMEIWEMGVHWGWQNPSLGSYEWFHRLKRKFTQISRQIRAVLSAFGFSMNRMKSERAIYWDFLWGAKKRKLCSNGSLISLWG